MSDHQQGNVWAYIGGLREDLGYAEGASRELAGALDALSHELADALTRIGELETRLRDHEQAVPHAESQS